MQAGTPASGGGPLQAGHAAVHQKVARKLAALLQSAAEAYLAHPPHFLPGAALSLPSLINFLKVFRWFVEAEVVAPVRNTSKGPNPHPFRNAPISIVM